MKTGAQLDIILLLTGTINVYNKQFTVLTNVDQRRMDYVDTIRYYLQHYPYRIVFVENSGENISGYFEAAIKDQRLEVLSFEGNSYPEELGKGLGEMNCIEYAVNNARLFTDNHFIFKITGRYRIANFPAFIRRYERQRSMELMADLTDNFRHSISAIFGFKKFFAQQYLFKHAHLLNDSKGFFFEHALSKAVTEAVSNGIHFELFRHYPKLVAISGTTGKPYRKSFFYMLPREIKYLLRYFIIMR
jgi:hypothetical protein